MIDINKIAGSLVSGVLDSQDAELVSISDEDLEKIIENQYKNKEKNNMITAVNGITVDELLEKGILFKGQAIGLKKAGFKVINEDNIGAVTDVKGIGQKTYDKLVDCLFGNTPEDSSEEKETTTTQEDKTNKIEFVAEQIATLLNNLGAKDDLTTEELNQAWELALKDNETKAEETIDKVVNALINLDRKKETVKTGEHANTNSGTEAKISILNIQGCQGIQINNFRYNIQAGNNIATYTTCKVRTAISGEKFKYKVVFEGIWTKGGVQEKPHFEVYVRETATGIAYDVSYWNSVKIKDICKRLAASAINRLEEVLQ